MIKKIYIITDVRNITVGHGESEDVKTLTTYGGYEYKMPPAFLSEAEAEKFIYKHCPIFRPKITELEVYQEV